ncbi:hypothetical protein E6O75_ATG03188 [Venturia nashicola]|uniref:Uncharacterized protein n=1 Tax=Venturia nashicola TaxID=86259 RepID=A0A4Z1PM14_9PEZI|nr:hypothetical protein E6O75_ATG03188 [Venturia nashicola]
MSLAHNENWDTEEKPYQKSISSAVCLVSLKAFPIVNLDSPPPLPLRAAATCPCIVLAAPVDFFSAVVSDV